MTHLHPTLARVTDRIIERSRPTREAYLSLMDSQRDTGVNRPRLSCGNLVHGFAASGEDVTSCHVLDVRWVPGTSRID